MKLPKLFARSNTGATLEWEVEVNGDEYVTSYGQVGGKIQTTLPVKCLPKNEGKKNATSGSEQAILESKALFKKQLKSGYFENIEDIDKETFVQPMLAKNFKDRKDKVSYPVVSQCKYNGGRCVATKNGLFSRKGERYMSVPHIENSLVEFFTKYPNAVLDGELMGDGFKGCLNETMKLIRKTVNIAQEDLENSEKLVKYWVYDCYGIDSVTKDSFYHERQQTIEVVMCGNPYYRKVDSRLCKDESEVMSHFAELVENGEEGSIIRLLDFPYENKRSASLLKLKPLEDSEAEIVDITEGLGNWAGTGKRITLKWKGVEFDATFKGTYEQGVEFLKDKGQWIGKTVTFLYNGLTGLGVPNYARVDINNCLK
jgi:DNA ligase-1